MKNKKEKITNTDQGIEPVKVRKVSSGPIRDKARTMNKMIAAVGKVLQKKGYTGLTAPNIAKTAGVDKKLVWTYFGGVDPLVEEYINQKDFFKSTAKPDIDYLLQDPDKLTQNHINHLLQNQFETLLTNRALQRIIHWEVGESNEILRKIADKREEIGEELFSKTIPYFEHSSVDIRARLALVISGIYYLTLHAKNNGSKFCGIDINTDEGKQRISDAIEELIFDAYDKVK
ncbi:TetR/AcrR family transcriptional regulator [Myroides sp. 1354]|uniref:TetR/AcrR family transcriptional regulator n=1 Tax=unclassified Myroides TaxID=2642485 RepID=UPI0025761D86|nr:MULTISPECIES: TetR/AcrR family transcriptional regulator [unclassified Myroides]MDM1044404.1 TetR/AcrR family transcriptional regulator [Myroides sp. R163-1]MDM1056279.1 TetR/AcrR family transcriptional regulator [Myroides sp. 1354]MDM1069365.1 TetR/AcrR family transcriptional regulator [Myroides sp. 1372]